MNNYELLPGEEIYDLLIHDLKIIQHREEFRFSLDAILLAHFAFVRPGIKAVDLGTGSGVIGLLLLARGAGSVIGVELNRRVASMAERSIALNGLAARMAILPADLRLVQQELPAGQAELVTSNPPYRPVGHGALNSHDHVAMARHELTANLDDVIAAARHLLKYRGRFAMVHLPERMTEVLGKLSAAGLEPKRLQLVYPKLGSKPNMLLVEAIRGAKPGLEVLPPFLVYHQDGTYTDAVMAYYKQVKT